MVFLDFWISVQKGEKPTKTKIIASADMSLESALK